MPFSSIITPPPRGKKKESTSMVTKSCGYGFPSGPSSRLTVSSFHCVLFVFGLLTPNTVLGTQWVIVNAHYTQ